MSANATPLRVSDLVGHLVAVEFLLESWRWPIDGCPAWCIVLGVDMPLICLESKFGYVPGKSRGIWLSTSIMKEIRDCGVWSDT